MIRLIVSGDDFGLHPSINSGIEQAHRDGILTSASLVANGEFFDDAVEVIQRNPGLGVGLHINFIEERPLAPAGLIPNLLEQSGSLRKDHLKLAFDVLRGRVKPLELQTELQAQIDRCRSANVKLTHVDSHRHLHMLPPVFSAIKPVLKQNGITRMRYLNPPLRDLFDSQLVKAGTGAFFKLQKAVCGSAFKVPDFFVGFFQSGGVNSQVLKSMLARLKRGTYEIGMHPAQSDEQLRLRYGGWDDYFDYKFSWQTELAALIDSTIREAAKSMQVQLISYESL